MRCETCFFFYKDKAVKLTPARAAKKLYQECLGICTGNYINPEKMEGLLNGEGAYWRKLKSTIIQPMLCACDGQIHFQAITALNEENNLIKKHEAAESLIKSALVSVKAKSAAVRYEEQVAFAYSLSPQIGHSGHSRKLVPDLVRCLIQVVNEKNKTGIDEMPSQHRSPTSLFYGFRQSNSEQEN